MATCNKQHRYLEGFNELPEAQDNRNGGRHICAACAYEEGLKDALNGNLPQSDLSHLPDSQAGTVRHKSAIAAYNLGYQYGKKSVVNNNIVKFLNFFFKKQKPPKA